MPLVIWSRLRMEKDMESPCWLCDIRPIESKKRPLCKLCYSRCHERHVLHIFPLLDKREEKIQRATRKYGKDFANDVINIQGSLVGVGNKYGITREMVRQYYFSFTGNKYTDVVVDRAGNRQRKNEEDRRERRKFENRFKAHKKNGSAFIGIVAENIFQQKCKSVGHDVLMMGPREIFDAKVNGLNVDVKCATFSKRSCQKSSALYYRFQTNKKQRDAVDYFAFYLLDVDTWYIIPKTAVSGLMFHLPKFLTAHGKGAKFSNCIPYKEAWHLLAGGNNP